MTGAKSRVLALARSCLPSVLDQVSFAAAQLANPPRLDFMDALLPIALAFVWQVRRVFPQ